MAVLHHVLIGVLSGLALPASAQVAPPGDGQLCLAAFVKTASDVGEPSSQTTWAPQRDSHFTFFIDGQLRATVGKGEIAHVKELPTNQPIRVRVRLDDRPFESFNLSLSKAPDRRICLWLYPGYWHWIDRGWDAKLGCQCGEKPR